jgi:hypothetical protein
MRWALHYKRSDKINSATTLARSLLRRLYAIFIYLASDYFDSHDSLLTRMEKATHYFCDDYMQDSYISLQTTSTAMIAC